MCAAARPREPQTVHAGAPVTKCPALPAVPPRTKAEKHIREREERPQGASKTRMGLESGR